MSETLQPHIQKLGNWIPKSKVESEQLRSRFINSVIGENTAVFRDKINHNRWGLHITDDCGSMMAYMFSAFEYGIRQVYYKVGYTDDQIDELPCYRFSIGNIPQHTRDSNGEANSSNIAPFAFAASPGLRRFVVDINHLHIAAQDALQYQGYIRTIPVEFAQNTKRPMNAFELCEIAGVEEAAHSLFLAYHDYRSTVDTDSTDPFSIDAHFAHPIEQSALKWKRNYALRFMLDFAQGFVDFENGLADR